jgi:hypothetical protein
LIRCQHRCDRADDRLIKTENKQDAEKPAGLAAQQSSTIVTLQTTITAVTPATESVKACLAS